MKDLKEKFDFNELYRSTDGKIWRENVPDYANVNYQYFIGKTQNHQRGSFKMFGSTCIHDVLRSTRGTRGESC